MKKILSLILALTIAFSFCACGSKPSTSNNGIVETDDTKAMPETTVPETTSAPEVDLLAIEEIEVAPKEYKGEYQISWKVKVRNISGADLPMKESSMKIFFKYLDNNNDILWTGYAPGGYTSTVADGQAEWISFSSYPSGWGAKEMNKIAAIEFYAYTTSTGGSPDHEFLDPITVKVSDYFDWADYNPQ